MKSILKLPLLILLTTTLISTLTVKASAVETAEIISTNNSREGVTITVNYTGLQEKRIPTSLEYTHPKTKERLLLSLVDSVFSDSIISDRTGIVGAVIEYGWQSYIPNPLEYISIDYHDKESQKTIVSDIRFDSLVMVQDFRWLDDVKADAVFEVYEAAYYRLKGSNIYIPYNNLYPEIDGYEKDIVIAINENADYLRFLGATWDGSVYKDKGIEKRNAIFHGERYVAQYEAKYVSEISLPDIPGFDCIATYQLNFQIFEQPSTVFEEQLDHVFEEPTSEEITINEKVEPITLLEKIVIAVAGALLISGFIVLILFMIRKQLERREYDEENVLLRRRSRKTA